MKNVLLLLIACAWGMSARAQASCNASMTHTVTGNTVSYVNTSTHPALTSNTSAWKYIQFYNGSPYNVANLLTTTYAASGFYTLPGPGNYVAVAAVYYADSSNPQQVVTCFDTTWYSIVVNPSPCYSVISNISGTGATRTFTASTPANTAGMTYSWIWGDGTTPGSGSPASHTYAISGTYTVTLVATGGGCTDSTFATVQITAPLNCANLSNSFTTSTSGSYVYFFSTSTAVTGATKTHTWSWGDGTPNTTTGNTSAFHMYAASGTYTVTLTTTWVQGNVTCTQTSTQTVSYTAPPCTVTFTSSGTGSTRTYTATNVAGTPGMTYNWWFGDGNTATGNPVTHTFAYGGQYYVTLEGSSATSNCSDSAVRVDTVTGPFNCGSAINAISGGAGTSMTKTFYGYANSNSVSGYTYTHNWNFGNGATATGSPVTYTYSAAGTYTVRLITNWYATNSTVIVCADTAYQTVTAGMPGFNCATAVGSFSYSGQNQTYQFAPFPNPAPNANVSTTHVWNFGDGSAGTTYNGTSISHTYAVAGTYTACLITRWYQAGTTNLLCTDTVCQTVVTVGPNVIDGYIVADSNVVGLDSFRVYLITYNASTSMLAAVDSVLVLGNGNTYYAFLNKPAGMYRTKAARLNQQNVLTGYVPTYHDSSLNWNTAIAVAHANSYTGSLNIYMRQGLVTSGPGFVGGSVLQGANKGTADSDPVINQLIFLRDAASGKLVRSAYTNAAGQYTFTNVPVGTYTVYPEEMNYTTTPSAVVTISSGNTSMSAISFKKDDVDMTIMPDAATGINAVAGSALAFSMVPNPTSGKMSISLAGASGKADVRVTSLTGQVVYTGSFAAGRASELDLAHLQSGVYFVTVSTATGAGTEKLIIAR